MSDITDPAHALGLHFEDDYAASPGNRWRQPWPSRTVQAMTAVGALLVGFLLTTGLTAGRQAAVAQDERKGELIALIDARQQRTDALALRLEELRGEVAAVEQSVASAGSAGLTNRLSQAEASAGLTAVKGPGVQMTFADGTGTCSTGRVEDCRIQDVDLQLATNVLWGLGAEAIAINGERVIATTAIRSAGSSVLINYRVLTSPYVIEAIGDAEILRDGFVASELAQDFKVWTDVFGLKFTHEVVPELTLPAYTGAVRLRTAVNPLAEDDT
jgi:uncharacterized protein YlxW (UPF0749 family)